jgi:hypothetical protein
MVFAADYPFLDIFWTMIIFFSWAIWIWIVISVLSDVFSRHDLSGWAKAAWVVFVIVLPFLGVLIYLIGNGGAMAQRRIENAQVTPGGGPVASASGSAAAEIGQAKQLLDSGAISQAEFDSIKAKALA